MELGDKIKFSEAVYQGSWPRCQFRGTRTIVGQIVEEKYRKDRQKQFTIKVEASYGIDPLDAGKRVVRLFKSILKAHKVY